MIFKGVLTFRLICPCETFTQQTVILKVIRPCLRWFRPAPYIYIKQMGPLPYISSKWVLSLCLVSTLWDSRKWDVELMLVFQSNPMNEGWGELPTELLLMVMSYLEAKELARLGNVNYHWKRVGEDDSLWKRLFYKDFTWNSETPKKVSNCNSCFSAIRL